MTDTHPTKKVHYICSESLDSEGSDDRPSYFEKLSIVHKKLKEAGYLAKMEVIPALPATMDEMSAFHDRAYLQFLSVITNKNKHKFIKERKHFNVDGSDGDICPIYDGMWEDICQIAGGTLMGARLLNEKKTDLVIHWQGGEHHPGPDDAAGMGYVNDCVLAIQELLKKHHRVLYIDIDIHHGDGVEEAFLESNRVMTASFHAFGHHALMNKGKKRSKKSKILFYPGTGKLLDCGKGAGKYYAVNVPINFGATDETYVDELFKPIITEIMSVFSPDAVVMECGADSLDGDELGLFYLSIEGHAECVRHVLSYNKPTLLLGGGGYGVPENAARCWVYETGVALGIPKSSLPREHRVIEQAPSFMYERPVPAKRGDETVEKAIQEIQQTVLGNLSNVKSAEEVREIERKQRETNQNVEMEVVVIVEDDE